jgi:hypothetical protein
MPDKPKVNRQVPGFPILLKGSAIPPIHVKLSIGKSQKLSNNV